MGKAVIEKIFIIPEQGGEPQERSEVEALAGLGLAGDHYCKTTDFLPQSNQDAVTFIAVEAIHACNTELGKTFAPEQFRRNILVSGIDLNALLNRRIKIGAAIFEPVELCEPCAYLSKLLNADLLSALQGRGGIRARILKGGMLKPGDHLSVL